MEKNNCKWLGHLVITLISLLVLGGCGGGSSSSSGGISTAKANISGTVSFPSLNSLVGKQVADVSAIPTVEVRDLNGSVKATATVTGSGASSDPFKYTATGLDSGVDYVIKVVSGNQVMKALVGKDTLSTSTTRDIDTIATTAVILAEKKLNVAPGTIGETQNSVTSSDVASLQPIALESGIKTAVNTVLHTPATATQANVDLVNLANVVAATVNSGINTTQFLTGAVTTPVSTTQYTLAGGTVSANTSVSINGSDAQNILTRGTGFTSVMISEKTFNYTFTGVTGGAIVDSGSATFNSNGTVTGSSISNGGSSGTWSINSSGQLIISWTAGFTSGQVNTFTLTNSTSTSLIANDVYTFAASPDRNGTGTITITSTASGVTDLQAISAVFDQFSSLFATSLPSNTNASLLALYDSATYLDDGQTNLASSLSFITTNQKFIGIKYKNITILSIDVANGVAKVAFDVFLNGRQEFGAPKFTNMIKKNGTWHIQGNQRIAQVLVQAGAEYYTGNNPSEIRTGLRLIIGADGGNGLTKAVVTGKGLPSQGVVLNKPINASEFTISGIPYGNRDLYKMADSDIAAIAESGEVYTIQLFNGTQLMATYTETLLKRPYLNSTLSAGSFPAINAPTLALLNSFNGGNITVNWTLPPGLNNDFLTVRLENSGNSIFSAIDSALLPTDTSKTLTINAVSDGGVSFTPVSRWIWVDSTDSSGISMLTAMF